jgi:hypothetical protein
MTTTTRTAPKPSKEAIDRYLGGTFYLPAGELLFNVTVVEVRNRFGHIDALVRPVSGKYKASWVQADRLS